MRYLDLVYDHWCLLASVLCTLHKAKDKTYFCMYIVDIDYWGWGTGWKCR